MRVGTMSATPKGKFKTFYECKDETGEVIGTRTSNSPSYVSAIVFAGRSGDNESRNVNNTSFFSDHNRALSEMRKYTGDGVVLCRLSSI